MQETFILTVKTADGKCLMEYRITGNYYSLYSLLPVLCNRFTYLLEDSVLKETGHGSGIFPFASASQSPMEQ